MESLPKEFLYDEETEEFLEKMRVKNKKVKEYILEIDGVNKESELLKGKHFTWKEFPYCTVYTLYEFEKFKMNKILLYKIVNNLKYSNSCEFYFYLFLETLSKYLLQFES